MSNKLVKLGLLFSLLLLPLLLLLLVRHFSEPNYVISSLYKVVFLAPLLYRVYLKKRSWKEAFSVGFSFQQFKKFFPPIISFGVIIAFVYGSSYFLFQEYIPPEIISNGLSQLAQIDATNILIIGLYIIVFNSLLEEFFWRGFLFKELAEITPRWIAYALTGISFSFHHIMFYYSWFSLPLLVVVTVGLVLFSIVMSLIFRKYNDLFSCWLIHALADVVQIFIGLKILGIV